MGIETRLRMLLEAVVERRPGSGVAADATDEVVDAAQDRLISACQRLVEPEQMGQLFKVLCIASKNCGLPPAFETSSKATGAAAATSTADVPPVL
jgi:SAM-dependent MidA family methyltransferase